MKAQIRMIIASVIVIALALTAVSGITYSWFSDTEQSKIEVTTAKVDYAPTYTATVNKGESGVIVDGTDIAITNLAPNSLITVNAEIENRSTIRTVYKIVAEPVIQGTSFTYYDLINIRINGVALTVSDLGNEIIVKDWTLADAETDISQSVTISTPEDYGGTLGAPIRSFNSSTGEGSTNEATEGYTAWDNETVRSGLTIEFTIVAVQGDYPYTTMDTTTTANTASAVLPANKVVKATESISSASGTGSVSNLVVDFSNVSTVNNEGTTVDSKTVKMKVTEIAESTVSLDLTLWNGDNEISSPEFDEPVVITMTVSEKITEPKITYNGTEDGKILSSTINSDNTTTIVVSVDHFSEYVIADTVVTNEAGLRKSLNAGGYVKLGANITNVSEPLVCKVSGTVLDLNGHTISTDAWCLIDVQNDLTIRNGTLQCTHVCDTSKDKDDVPGRVINIESQIDKTLTLKNVDIVGPTVNQYNRGISAYGNTSLTINIDGGNISANHYALNIAAKNTGMKCIVKNATITGYAAVQTYSEKSVIEFTKCTLNGKNQWDAGSNDYGTIVVGADGDASGAGSVITCTDCKITATEGSDAYEYLLDLRAACNIILNDCEFVSNDTKIEQSEVKGYKYTYISYWDTIDAVFVENGNELTITCTNAEYATVSDAEGFAKALSNGRYIKLGASFCADVSVSAGKSVVLDLNGYTLTDVSSDTVTVGEGAFALIWDLTDDCKGAIDNITHGKAALKTLPGSETIIYGGTFSRSAEAGTSAGNGGNSYYTIENQGRMEINYATILNKGAYSSMIRNGYENNGTIYAGSLTLNYCTLNGGKNAVKVEPGSTLVVNDSELINTAQYVIHNYGTVTLNGGEYIAKAKACLSAIGQVFKDTTKNTVAEYTIKGGNFSGEHLIHGFYYTVDDSDANDYKYTKSGVTEYNSTTDVTTEYYSIKFSGGTVYPYTGA